MVALADAAREKPLLDMAVFELSKVLAKIAYGFAIYFLGPYSIRPFVTDIIIAPRDESPILQGVFQQRAGTLDYNYEGFRDLALRLQDYAKVYPEDADLRAELIHAPLEPLRYAGGDTSRGYRIAILRRLRLFASSQIMRLNLFIRSQFDS